MQVTGFLYFLSLIILNPNYTPLAIFVESLIYISTIAFLIFSLFSSLFIVHGKLIPALVEKVTSEILYFFIYNNTYHLHP